MFMEPAKIGVRKCLVAGIDTHAQTHHVALVDPVTGALVAQQAFTADQPGYLEALAWMRASGRIARVGMEQSRTYGAGLTRVLHEAGLEVIEINHAHSKQLRARSGKTDALDAYQAALAAASGRQTGLAKRSIGAVDALRALLTLRSHLVKTRQRLGGAVQGMIVSAPEELRAQLRELKGKALLARITAWRPDPNRLLDPVQAVKHVLKQLASQLQDLDRQIKDTTDQIQQIVEQVAPTLLAQPGVGPWSAAVLLCCMADPDRIRSEAAFAKITGVAPIPASSGKTTRVRLSRQGNRQANRALYIIALNRLQHDPRSKTYYEKKQTEGKSKPEAIRALKRHICRNLYPTLKHDLQTWLDKP